MSIPLTPQQHALFFRLAQHDKDGELFGHIIPIPIDTSQYVIYLRGSENLYIRQISDLDALSEVGLLDFELSRMGTSKRYFVTDIGRKAIKLGMFEGQRFTRLVFVQEEASVLKPLLSDLLSGDSLSTALMEINFVHNLLDVPSPDPRSIRIALEKTGALLLACLPHADLLLATRAITTFGRWSQAIADLL